MQVCERFRRLDGIANSFTNLPGATFVLDCEDSFLALLETEARPLESVRLDPIVRVILAKPGLRAELADGCEDTVEQAPVEVSSTGPPISGLGVQDFEIRRKARVALQRLVNPSTVTSTLNC